MLFDSGKLSRGNRQKYVLLLSRNFGDSSEELDNE